NKAKKFVGKAKIKSIKPNDKYGNLWFEVPESIATDYPNGLIVYGSTATTTAITWDGVNEQYTFNNPKDYLTNDLTKNLVVGQEIDVELIRADFEKAGKVPKDVYAVMKNATQIDPTAIAVSGDVLEVEEGKTITLTAETTPAFTTRKLTWASSDETVATVKDGKVTGVKAGTTKITASYGTIVSNEVTITVKASTSPVTSYTSVYTFDASKAVADGTSYRLASDDGKVNFLHEKGTSNTAVNYTYSEVRVYVGHIFTISLAEEGAVIKEISFKTIEKHTTAEKTTASDSVIEVTNTSNVKITPNPGTSTVVINTTAQFRFSTMTINWEK
ncbi:MAG: Ig-like domain-containing protein, partial [Candidatus Onthovivens sp.]|nr:Ig-like domain-containing protein [Candidatus Onthovivens sp.]